MDFVENLYPVQSFYLFQSQEKDPVTAFEKMTKFRVNRTDIYVYPITPLKEISENLEGAKNSWWNSFIESGWSHITFGTVSTRFGIAILCLATGPAGWVSGVLAIGGGLTSILSGGGQLLSTDPSTKKVFAQLGNASLSLNNIPGFTLGTATYMLTGSYDRSVKNANFAGIAAGFFSFAKTGMNAVGMQKLYNLEVGLGNTSWGSRTRNINAMLMEIDPIRKEGSHLIPQRVIRDIVQQFPSLKRPLENLNNGPLGIRFMTPLEHALNDSYRYRTLPIAQKEVLAACHPFRTMLLENHPNVADVFGFIPNMSPTLRPVANSLVITSGRTIKPMVINSTD